MSPTKVYLVEELDEESRDYLCRASESGGEGMPGLCVSIVNHLVWFSFVVGLVVLAATV